MSINEKINCNYITTKIKSYNFTATTNELLDLSKFIETADIKNLSININAIKENNFIIIKGNILASIVQHCIVSLEPINNTLNIKLNKKYYISNKKKSKEIIINLNQEDEEELINNTVNIKEIIQEELILNINPYPKIINLANTPD